MTQYISKSALVAKIKDMKGCKKSDWHFDEFDEGYKSALEDILSFINTLEVKKANSYDAFIKKACEWLKENFSFDEAGYCKTNIYSTESMIYDFKNTLEGKL